MVTASLLPLQLLVVASCLAQDVPQNQFPMDNEICSLQGTAITCTCRSDLEALTLTGSYGGAETLHVDGCSSVTFAATQQQTLYELSVSHTASVTFNEMASPFLRHLALVNVSQVVLHGAIFHGTDLQTVLFDGVRVSTLPSGALTNVTKLENVTFRDVHIDAVEQGAVFIQMVDNSEFTILNSKLLGVDKGGIVLKGVTKFTMNESTLTTVGDDGLRLHATGAISISGSLFQATGPIEVSVKPGASFTLINNVWRKLSLLELAQQLLTFSVGDVKVVGNTFQCACEPGLDKFIRLPAAAPLIDSNQCDEGLCGVPVSMRVLTGCRDQTALQAECKAVLPGGATTPPPSGSTVSPRMAKPMSSSSNSTATALAVSVTTALLLAVPAVAALAL